MKTYIAMVFLALWIQWGCAGAKKSIESEPAPVQAMATPNPELTPQEGTIPTTEHYTVIPKDSLWKIAGKVFAGDCFQWPALFKANRDSIQDPDLIYPKQVLVVDRGQDKAKCRDLALRTPRYKAHSHPRAKLPLDYF